MDQVPVYFRPEMAAPAFAGSPSARKPPLVVDDWRSAGFAIDVRTFAPAVEPTLSLAHDPAYVRGVLACEINNGFFNRDADVARSLPYTSGAMVAAAREALDNGRVACAPVAGFHHACYAEAQGYCTFNGLMVAALAVRKEWGADKIGILDLDHHWGNGTHDIALQLKANWLVHHSSGQSHPTAHDADGYLKSLARRMESFRSCDLLLYQAGADAHIDDPLGGWMTSRQLSERDRIVFESASRLQLPVAWNLAGGYQTTSSGGLEPVLAIHRETMRVCCDVHVGAP